MDETFIDPATAEEILESCLEELNADPPSCVFTVWEMTFLESLEAHLEERTITEDQWQKLKQIYRERVLRIVSS